jgi:hypothetical protein
MKISHRAATSPVFELVKVVAPSTEAALEMVVEDLKHNGAPSY